MSQPAADSWPFYFLDELVLRTPAIPFVARPDEQMVNKLLQDPHFLEAVYLASPVLHGEVQRLAAGQITDEKEISKIKASLIKYYQRMYSRCTPFGLFSGCALVKWNEEDGASVVLSDEDFLRSTRLDMHYLCALGQRISSLPVIRNRLTFFPNNSAYHIGEELRYVEFRYQSGRRHHQISSVSWSAYLEAVLEKAKQGASLPELTRLLIELAEVSEQEASEFIQEMISSQVLISEMDPAITGDEFIYQLITILRRINEPKHEQISALINRLENLVSELKGIDNRFHNDIAVIRSLTDKIRELEVDFEENKLLQADMFSRPAKETLSGKHKAALKQAVQVLAKLFKSTANENLTSFAERFRKRYEDRWMPLLQVLDAETGIGYPEQSGSNLSPLVENLVLPANSEPERYDIMWNKAEQWLFHKLLASKDKEELVIEEQDLGDFSADYSIFPPSLSVMFSLAANGDVIFRGATGSSAANLLGRFAHADDNICNLVKKIVAEEQQKNPNIIFAEIVHLPEDRVGNILLHPAFREYEIPFLARSSRPLQQQVLLQDIMISVQQDNYIRLFSISLQKEIIPRLSSAHNFSFRSLPVYHFLADMQTQRRSGGLIFNWGVMARHFKKLPAVRTGNVILFEATWQLEKKDAAILFDEKRTVTERITAFREQWKLPEYFVLADGDNELLVNTRSGASSDTFIRSVKGREGMLLKEFRLPDPGAVQQKEGGAYCNQFIAVLMNEQQVYKGSEFYLAPNESIQRQFLPGSEWLYYKLYCGTKTADELLLTLVQPLVAELLEAGLIDKWFFIRYNDPDFHLRVRFHLKELNHAGPVMQAFLQLTEPQQEAGLVWKVQMDTYQRETERYGQQLTALAEDLFFTDSRTKLRFLQLTEGDEREKFRWLWALRGVDELLNAFDYTPERKYALLQHIQQQFAAEFNADKALFRQLNQQYNSNRKEIMAVMATEMLPGDSFLPLLQIYQLEKAALRLTATEILAALPEANREAAADNLMGSYIHMSLNRIFLSEPRLHELVIYDLLCSHYRAGLKRKSG